ncbi:hypothetical protein TIFTF001_036712 [Ficus carica]|uniref:Uncharacterized protein n=1 Tax=Ficus carica TaxID=3494 RepID=A0AA88E3X8_FICCA|nr:hypothetical protein TIFTF001_036712 [Ficus carica]
MLVDSLVQTKIASFMWGEFGKYHFMGLDAATGSFFLLACFRTFYPLHATLTPISSLHKLSLLLFYVPFCYTIIDLLSRGVTFDVLSSGDTDIDLFLAQKQKPISDLPARHRR